MLFFFCQVNIGNGVSSFRLYNILMFPIHVFILLIKCKFWTHKQQIVIKDNVLFVSQLFTFHSRVCIVCQVSPQSKNLQFHGIQENDCCALSMFQSLFIDSIYVAFPVLVPVLVSFICIFCVVVPNLLLKIHKSEPHRGSQTTTVQMGCLSNLSSSFPSAPLRDFL